MKIINLPRGMGKTQRALCVSEYEKAPILVSTITEKRRLQDIAQQRGFTIPEPIVIHELRGANPKKINNGIIIDEVFKVLDALLVQYATMPVPIKLVTFSEEMYNKD